MKKAYIGTYTRTGSKGIYKMDFDENTGEIQNVEDIFYLANPTYLQFDKYLYSISETEEKGGMAAVINAEKKEKKGGASANGTGFCHICLDNDKRYVVTASYHGGYFAVFRLENESNLVHLQDYNLHGKKQSHCHFVTFTKDNKHLLVVDLGLCKVLCYDFNHESGEAVLKEKLCYTAREESGPRHLVINPENEFIYLLNELDSTIDVLRFNKDGMKCVFTISTLPENANVQNSCAAIKLTSDARFVYVSNRGHDSIAGFKTNEDGTLTLISHTPTAGNHPRDFEIDPTGQFLIAANMNSNNIVVFKMNKEQGELTQTDITVELPMPVCIKFE